MRFLWIIIVIIIAGGTWYYYSGGANKMAHLQENSPIKAAEEAKMKMEQRATDTMTTGDNSGSVVSGQKTFTVLGGHYYYDIKEIRVKKGDTVTITFKSEVGNHDLRIDEFNIATKVVGAGKESTVTFIADKAGEFEYYCSVGDHRAKGQKGKLIVTE
jgi:plastocyanin